jgi:hypothetical protein
MGFYKIKEEGSDEYLREEFTNKCKATAKVNWLNKRFTDSSYEVVDMRKQLEKNMAV